MTNTVDTPESIHSLIAWSVSKDTPEVAEALTRYAALLEQPITQLYIAACATNKELEARIAAHNQPDYEARIHEDLDKSRAAHTARLPGGEGKV